MRANRFLDCCLFGTGGFLLVLGIGLAIAWPYIFQDILTSNLLLANNSKTYNLWVRTPLPMYLDLYIFNWTNAEEFKANPKKVKPAFEEIGPFIFREVHERVNVTWNDDGSVSYNQTRKWTFVPKESRPLNTSITNVNIIALTVAYATKGYKAFEKLGIGTLLMTEGSLFVTRPASEWLFDGMDLKLLNFLNKKLVKPILPFSVPDKFGFFYERNMSSAFDGRFKALTGSNELEDLGMLVEWNDRNKTDFYPDSCGHVKGSSGEIFPPTKNNQDIFTLFISDVCSALALKYSKDRTIAGVTGREFVGDETMFGNNDSIPEQACYCGGRCQPPGVRNLTLCRQGAPVFASFPHFYLADESYLKKIDGLSPNQSLHEFRIAIDPVTGIPVDVRAQLQVNVLLDDYGSYLLYKNVPRLYLPVLWFSQRASITPSLASQALLLSTVHSLALSLIYVLSGIGLLMIIARLWLRYKKTALVEDEEPIIQTVDS